MLPIHLLSASLVVVTALLLLVAEFGRARLIGRVAVVLAMLIVLGADALLLAEVPQIGGLWGPSGNKAPKKKAQRAAAEDEEDGEMQTGRDAADAGGSGSGWGGRDARSWLGATLAQWRRPNPTAPGRKAGDVIKDCADCPDMVVLPPGTARNAEMPAPMASASQRAAEVGIWPGFAIGRREVTRLEYERFLAQTGSKFAVCSGRPIASVVAADPSPEPATTLPTAAPSPEPAACLTTDAALAYVNWLSGHAGHRYRLATATEWLYAADLAPNLPGGPDAMGPRGRDAAGSGGADAAVAEIVSDCWRNAAGVLAVTYGHEARCVTRTVVDVPREADQSSDSILPRLPMAAGNSSPMIGLRVVRELD